MMSYSWCESSTSSSLIPPADRDDGADDLYSNHDAKVKLVLRPADGCLWARTYVSHRTTHSTLAFWLPCQ
jgi:hypothetical protein